MRRSSICLIAFVASCSGAAKDCTAIGCTDAVLVNAPAGVNDPASGVLTVCIEGSCKETAFEAGPGRTFKHIQFEGMEGQVVTAELVMPDGAQYNTAVELKSSRPNGPGCGPVCIEAELFL